MIQKAMSEAINRRRVKADYKPEGADGGELAPSGSHSSTNEAFQSGNSRPDEAQNINMNSDGKGFSHTEFKDAHNQNVNANADGKGFDGVKFPHQDTKDLNFDRKSQPWPAKDGSMEKMVTGSGYDPSKDT